jgi:hypothetical protein
MITHFKDTQLKKLVEDIAKEHYDITSDLGLSNLSYLWFMYANGSKKGDFKPFIFLAEVNLLVRLNYLDNEEKRNIIGLMISSDEDNIYIAGLSILELRKQRIKDLGKYTKDNKHYELVDYHKEVIKPDDFKH